MLSFSRYLFFLFLFASFGVSSQPLLQIKAGVNRSSMNMEYNDYRWGFHAGAAAMLDNGLTDLPDVTLVDQNGLPLGQITGGNNRNLQLGIGYTISAKQEE